MHDIVFVLVERPAPGKQTVDFLFMQDIVKVSCCNFPDININVSKCSSTKIYF